MKTKTQLLIGILIVIIVTVVIWFCHQDATPKSPPKEKILKLTNITWEVAGVRHYKNRVYTMPGWEKRIPSPGYITEFLNVYIHSTTNKKLEEVITIKSDSPRFERYQQIKPGDILKFEYNPNKNDLIDDSNSGIFEYLRLVD